MQQLGAATHHTAPFLVNAWQVTRHVDDDHQRYAERIAETNETRCLLGTFGVQAAAQAQRIVGQHTDGAAGQSAEADHHRRCPFGLELLERLVGIQQRFHEGMYVIGATGRLRQQGVQIDIAGLGFGAVKNALLAEHSDQSSSACIGIGFIVGDDMAHA